MFDLLAAAERCRVRARRCELLAKETTSAPFAQCYRELAKLLFSPADHEEDFVRRDWAVKQPGNLLKFAQRGDLPGVRGARGQVKKGYPRWCSAPRP
jgi:hypothetical protein